MHFITHLFLQFLYYYSSVSTKYEHNLQSAMRIYKNSQISDNARYEKSLEINRYLNKEAAEPCDDFYEYSCGNWKEFHKNASINKTLTPEYLLKEKIDQNLLDVLSENITIRDNHAIRKVKIFYKSCLVAAETTNTHDIEYQKFLSNFIKSNGGFPAVPGFTHDFDNYDWQLVVALLRYRYGFDILIGLSVDINYQNIYENSIYLTEPSTLIPKSVCSIKSTKCHLNFDEQPFKKVKMEVAKNLILWLNLEKQQAHILSVSIVQFDYELCSAMEDRPDMPTAAPLFGQYARETLKTFNHLYNNTLDFHRIVTESYGVPIYKPVYMRTPLYYEKLIKIMNNSNTTIIANYIMYRALAQINFPSYINAKTKSHYCLDIMKIYFSKILGELYYHNYIKSFINANEVQHIYEKLKEVFHWKLQKQSWIPESIRRLGQYKLSKLILNFPNYEDAVTMLPYEFVNNNYWYNLELVMQKRSAEELNRLLDIALPMPNDKVESYETRIVYRPYHNRIDIGWGLLQMPYYHYRMPYAIRYAILGQKIAETLIKAFDEYGWTSDPKGNNNWDNATANEFNKRTICFYHQISNYLSNDPNKFNNHTTLKYLRNKSVALSLAFDSYLNWLEYQNPHNDHDILSNETLKDVNFSNTQLFFITFAQNNCKMNIEDTKNQLKYFKKPFNNHQTIEHYEVNGLLSNFIEFAREFKCPIGGRMNYANKCFIYD